MLQEGSREERKRQNNGGVVSGGRERQKERYKWDDRGWREGGGQSCELNRGEENTEPNLLPFGASTFHPIVFFPSLFDELCQSQSIAQMKLWDTSLEKI